MLKRTPIWAACALVACGGRSGPDVDTGGAAGSMVDAPSGGQSGQTDSGATGAGGGDGTAGHCVLSADAPDFREFTCADLKSLAISDVVVRSDGFVSPGQVVPLQMLLSDISGKGFNWYPGVALEADRADVTFTFDDWRYAILPCDRVPLKVLATFAPTVPIGTTVHIVARPASVNTKCPDAPTFAFAVAVR